MLLDFTMQMPRYNPVFSLPTSGLPPQQATPGQILAHEIGHGVFGEMNEQRTVNRFENDYLRELGIILRGKY